MSKYTFKNLYRLYRIAHKEGNLHFMREVLIVGTSYFPGIFEYALDKPKSYYLFEIHDGTIFVDIQRPRVTWKRKLP